METVFIPREVSPLKSDGHWTSGYRLKKKMDFTRPRGRYLSVPKSNLDITDDVYTFNIIVVRRILVVQVLGLNIGLPRVGYKPCRGDHNVSFLARRRVQRNKYCDLEYFKIKLTMQHWVVHSSH